MNNLGRWTVWTWDAREPMASYLTTASIGEFDIKAYKADGIKYWDAIDPDLFRRPAPRTGRRFALSNVANSSYKRLTRTINVPAGGAKLSFWVDAQHRAATGTSSSSRRTPPGMDDWTTLPDLNGHTSQDTGFVCPFWLELHPFLEHYQRENADGGCDPQGTTGTWNAVSGASDGYEQWVVDLTPLHEQAGRDLAQLRQRQHLQLLRRVRRRHRRSGRPGLDVVRDDGNTLDGWTTPDAPAGQRPEREHLVRRAPRPTRPTPPAWSPRRTLARQPEIIRFLSGIFGPYPFSSAGAIVDDLQGLGFALENQTRAVYARDWFEDRTDPVDGDSVVVHELAHQWTGDYLALAGVAAHLAQRGLRDLHRVALERARGPRPGAGVLRRPRVDPGRRLVLGAGDRRPGPGRAVRRRGL